MEAGAGQSQAAGAGGGSPPSEEDLRAAYEQQIKRVQMQDLILENVVTLLNLGMRRTGLSPGTEDERAPDQVRLAIESVRALLPLLEQSPPQGAPQDYLRQIRDALSQLQMAFVQIGGQASGAGGESSEGGSSEGGPSGGGPAGGGEPPAPGPSGAPGSPKSEEPGPAQRSGRLWVPGQ